MRLRLHSFEPTSRANGPGLRAVVWFQGCSIGCPACFNPWTHDPASGYETDTVMLHSDILGIRPAVTGISVSGGEPFQQPEPLLDLAARCRASGLSILVFSGYVLERIQSMPLGGEILSCVDVLIAGPYAQGQHRGRGLLGSANQKIHLLTNRHSPAEIAQVPAREVILHRDGIITLSGINPSRLLNGPVNSRVTKS